MSEHPSHERERVEGALERLKIFPLPSSVLIPEGHLPFHLFEPRYREMIAECLDSDRVLAIATLAPGWEADYAGRPAVHEVIGVGYVEDDERLSDGRTNILLRGVARARIAEEHGPHRSYREVRAELLPERRDGDAALLSTDSLRLRQLVLELASRVSHASVAGLARACAGEANPGRLADLVGSATLVDPSARQAFLEELEVGRRLDVAAQRLAEILLETAKLPDGSVPS